MFESPADVARKYRAKAEHYRELATITKNTEMRLTFLQAVAAYEYAAAMADGQAAMERTTASRG